VVGVIRAPHFIKCHGTLNFSFFRTICTIPYTFTKLFSFKLQFFQPPLSYTINIFYVNKKIYLFNLISNELFSFFNLLSMSNCTGQTDIRRPRVSASPGEVPRVYVVKVTRSARSHGGQLQGRAQQGVQGRGGGFGNTQNCAGSQHRLTAIKTLSV
jgi:hypothetical protein